MRMTHQLQLLLLNSCPLQSMNQLQIPSLEDLVPPERASLKHGISILRQTRISRGLQGSILGLLRLPILPSSLQIPHGAYDLSSSSRLVSLKHMSSLLGMRNYGWKAPITSLWLCS